MEEKQTIEQAREQLRNSAGALWSDFKGYGRAIVDHASQTVDQQIGNYYVQQEARAQERESQRNQREAERLSEAQISERTQDHKVGMEEALRERDRQERAERRLQFREGIKQKVSSGLSKLGKLKTDLIEKLNLANLGVKAREIWDKTSLFALEELQKGKELSQEFVDKVTDFANTQVANHYLHQQEREQQRAERQQERESQRNQREAERLSEAQISERTQDHKVGMEEALRERDRQERAERRLQFREGIKQKVSSGLSKLGKLKNDLLAKLNLANLDVKARELWDKVSLFALEGLQKGKEFAQGVVDKVTDFATTQEANHYLRQQEREQQRAERQQERESQRNQREAERLSEAQISERTQDHKVGMEEALRERDRQERAERRLQFREGIKQKVSAAISGLGRLKQAAVDKISDFMATQQANHYIRLQERDQERERKAFERAARKAEQEAIDLAKQQLRERKTAMAAALNAQERSEYDQRHAANEQRKQELMAQLFGNGSNEVEPERVARAM